MKIVAVEPLGITTADQEHYVKEWTKWDHFLKIYKDRTEDPEELIQRIGDADILLISNIPLPKEVLEKGTQLKMISVAFTGLDHIDLKYCQERGILVKNCAGYATTAVAELAIGLMIDLYRRITPLDQEMRNGKTRNHFLGRQLKGKTVGIVGTGAIGLETARLAHSFGCNVMAWSRSERKQAIEMGITYVTLPTLMAHSDIISLHTPLNTETHHLIDRDLLQKCKKSAILINTARGNIVDIEAVAQALTNGTISGAAFDVFEKEPPLSTDHPLLHTPNTIIVPHIAYATEESFSERVDMVFQNVKEYLHL